MSDKSCGQISWQGYEHTAYGDLYELDDFDKAEYYHVQLKENERLFRYKTEKMINFGPVLIKIKIPGNGAQSGLLYFLEESDSDRAWFETKGIKAKVNIY